MRYLSVCSGIEAATCAWHHMGWEPVAFSEIEKFPSAVLTHHYPSVPNWGDMTKFQEWPDANVDVLVGGTPCQSFSVAGLRKGLDDPRGNLMLTFGAIAQRYRPQWLVWENVPGVLSSNGGRDFGTFLGMLGELGYGFAYRVLDAQYFGVAQRRRRVFVVGHLGNWQRAAAVLFERHSLSGHPAPSRQARKGTAGGVAPSATASGWWDGGDVAATITTKSDDQRMPDKANAQLVLEPVAIQGTLIGRGENAGPQGSGADVSGAMFTLKKTDVHAVAQPVAFYDYLGSQNGGVEIGISPTLKKKDGVAITQPMAVAFAQNTRDEVRLVNGDGQIVGALAAEPGMKQTSYVAQPVAMRESGQGYWMQDEVAGTLRAEGEDRPSRPSHVIAQPTAYNVENSTTTAVMQPIGLDEEQNARIDGFGTLKARMESGGFQGSVMTTAMQVRRLTPVECERLQGFPDGYTAIPWRGKPESPDGPRYKALGNSMAVPVMQWIGERINQVEEL